MHPKADELYTSPLSHCVGLSLPGPLPLLYKLELVCRHACTHDRPPDRGPRGGCRRPCASQRSGYLIT